MTKPEEQPVDLDAIERDSRNLIYVSDGTSGSDKVARLLTAVPHLIAALRDVQTCDLCSEGQVQRLCRQCGGLSPAIQEVRDATD